MKQTIHQVILATSLITLLFTINCGDDSTATVTSSDSSAGSSFPSGMVITSPTNSSSSESSSLSRALSSPDFDAIASDGTYTDKLETFQTILAAASDEACQVELPSLNFVDDVNCYGPNLDYQNHPDGAPAEGDLPTGDLGIWTASENGEACVAAKINSLINATANKVDYGMLLSASMVCLMSRAETDLPTNDGDSEDLTSELNTAIQVNNADVSVTAASISNLEDVEDTDSETRDVFYTTVTVSDESDEDTITIEFFLKHMPTSDDNSTFKGKIWAEIDGASGAGDKDAFSITYERESSTSLKYKMLAANYQLADDDTVIFEDNGDIDIAGDWSGNMSQAIINLDPSTGLGDFSYAWQAGNGDDKARIFNGFTTTDSGCGFFGYGDEFDNDAGTATDNVIDGFICNWAGPGNDHSMSGTESLAQKQCMDLTEGVYVVDTDRNNISYAPVNSCNGDGNVAVRVTDSGDPYISSPTENDLVDLESDEDFADYVAPTSPTMPSNF